LTLGPPHPDIFPGVYPPENQYLTVVIFYMLKMEKNSVFRLIMHQKRCWLHPFPDRITGNLPSPDVNETLMCLWSLESILSVITSLHLCAGFSDHG